MLALRGAAAAPWDRATASPATALRVLADAAAPSPQKIDLAFCSRLCDALARDASALRSPTALRIARG